MFTGIIYQVLHIDSGKCYIGQTIEPLPERKRKHLRKAFHKNRQNALCKALREFGERRFEFIQLEEVQASTAEKLQTVLDEKEVAYIQQYNSREDGFNTKPGGQGYTERRTLPLEEKQERKEQKGIQNKAKQKAYYEENREIILAGRRTPEYREKIYARRDKRFDSNPELKEQTRKEHKLYMQNNRDKQKARCQKRMSDPIYRKNKRDREREKRNIAQRIRRAKKKQEATQC